MSKKKSKSVNSLETLITFSASEALSSISARGGVFEQPFYVDDWKVKTISLRYKVFRKQPKCVCCDRTIHSAKLQYHPSNKVKTAHFNFFSKDGMLMTKDHIQPKSKGGSDRLSNLQTMCEECNSKKGNRIV